MSNAEVFTHESWDVYARCYDSLTALVPYQELRALVIKLVCGYAPGGYVLDVGCGTGNLLSGIEARCSARLTGIDASSSMLALARAKCSDAVHLWESDINDALPFPDNHFDVVTSINVLYAVASPEALMREMCRVLKPGGMLVLETPKLGYDNGIILARHCNSQKPDSYWENPHSSAEREELLVREALHDESLVQDMLHVAKHNRIISRTAQFHFLTSKHVCRLVENVGMPVKLLMSVYADQGTLVSCQKGARRENT